MKLSKKSITSLLATVPLFVLPITVSCANSVNEEQDSINTEKNVELQEEIKRIQNINNNEITPKKLDVSQLEFNNITEKNILDKINIKLERNKFDYQVDVGSFNKESNKISFEIMVGIKNTNEFILVNDKVFSVTFNVLPIIEIVEIIGLNKSYIDGSRIDLKANVIMSNNAQVPINDLAYEWILDGQVVSRKKDYSFDAKFVDNNKKLKLKVTYAKGDSIVESNVETLVIDQKITSVSILGLNPSYIDGDMINLRSNVTMFDNAQVPTEGITYEWLLDNHKVGDQKDYSFVANFANNNKTIQLRVSYKDQLIESSILKLVINKNSQQILNDEINRILGLNNNINLNDPKQVTQDEFNRIDSQYIIDNFGNELGLNKLNFDYQIISISNKSLNQKSFLIKVRVKNTGEYKVVEDKEFVATFSIDPIITSVSILGLNPSYTNGDPINLRPNITMSNNGQVPTNGVKYEWLLNGIFVSDHKNYDSIASVVDNNKTIQLRVTYKGQTMKSSISKLVINKNSQQIFDDEIKRLNNLNVNLTKPEQITQQQFDQINEQYLLNNFKSALGLNEAKFDYKLIIIKRESSQIEFKISVSIKGLNNYQEVFRRFTANFNVEVVQPIIPTITSVSILGLNPSYIDGEMINLRSNITMSDNAQVPTEGITYEWLLDNQKVGDQKDYSFVANFANNNKTIQLRVTYNGQLIESAISTLVINKNSQQILDDEVMRLINLNVNLIKPEQITQQQFDQINEQYLLNNFKSALGLNEAKFDYKLIITKRESSQIEFKISVSIKGLNNYQEVFRRFTATFNIEPIVLPTIASVSISGLNPSYTEKDMINLKSNITMSDNAQVPTEGITYEWLLDNQKVGDQKDYSFVANIADNNKTIKLRVSYNDQFNESQELTIKIDPIPEPVLIVTITNAKPFYIEGDDPIRLIPKFTMSDGSKPPKIKQYIWIIDGNQDSHVGPEFVRDPWCPIDGTKVGLRVITEDNKSYTSTSTITLNVYIRINSVSIIGLNSSYNVGDIIRLKSKVYSSFLNSTPWDLVYQWMIDDEIVSDKRDYEFKARIGDNGRRIKLRVLYHGNQVVDSTSHIIVVNKLYSASTLLVSRPVNSHLNNRKKIKS